MVKEVWLSMGKVLDCRRGTPEILRNVELEIITVLREFGFEAHPNTLPRKPIL